MTAFEFIGFGVCRNFFGGEVCIWIYGSAKMFVILGLNINIAVSCCFAKETAF